MCITDGKLSLWQITSAVWDVTKATAYISTVTVGNSRCLSFSNIQRQIEGKTYNPNNQRKIVCQPSLAFYAEMVWLTQMISKDQMCAIWVFALEYVKYIAK